MRYESLESCSTYDAALSESLSFSLPRVQAQYASKVCSADYYQQSMSRVTSAFQALSKEVLELIGVFRAGGLSELVRLLESLQAKEKEKLDATVRWQIMTQRERVAQKSESGAAECQNGDDHASTVSEDEKKGLRRRYAWFGKGSSMCVG